LVANLHRGVALGREDVGLVALLDAFGGERREALLGGPEADAEPAPLPARDDGQLGCPAFRPFAKYCSALCVFVACSPETSIPRPARTARASAATWKASAVPARVESSRIRVPSG